MSHRDQLLVAICEVIQLSAAKYERANQSYVSVGEWLDAEGSVFANDSPMVYPQGSFALQTTIRPRGEVQEYDLDFVLELEAGGRRYRNNPEKLLDDLEARLRENKRYEGMISRKKRCICIEYADDFHMDVLPGLPKEGRGNTHKIVVPDRKLKTFKASNPKGYKHWFEGRSVVRMRKDADVQPLAPMQTAAQKSILCNIVQLSKRARDTAFDDPETAPRSIVLTTLLAKQYDGGEALLSSWINALAGIEEAAQQAQPRRLVVLNPTNEEEDFSERWDEKPDEYNEFVDWVQQMHQQVAELGRLNGQAFHEALFELFGEKVVSQAIELQAERTDSLRSSGRLQVQTQGSAPGRLGSASSAAAVTIKKNTFYGED